MVHSDLSELPSPQEEPEIWLAELRELNQQLAQYLEWHRASGSLGLEPASSELRASRPSELTTDEPLFAPGGSQPSPLRGEARSAGGAPPSTTNFPRENKQQHGAARAPSPAPLSQAAAPTQERSGRALAPSSTPAAPPPRALPYIEPPRGVPLVSAPESQAPRLSPEETQTRLKLLAEQAAECNACRLCERRKQAVFSRGNGSSGICFVGEGPGADEDRLGEPFVGKAGQLLDKMIQAMGVKRSDVYICNIVKCRPPENRKPAPDEMRACRHFLEEQLELMRPQVIIALGASSVEGLLGYSGGIKKLRGQWRLYKGSTLVMPTFHPAYLLRDPRAKREVWDDLKQVMGQIGLRGGSPKPESEGQAPAAPSPAGQGPEGAAPKGVKDTR